MNMKVDVTCLQEITLQRLSFQGVSAPQFIYCIIDN